VEEGNIPSTEMRDVTKSEDINHQYLAEEKRWASKGDSMTDTLEEK